MNILNVQLGPTKNSHGGICVLIDEY